MQFSYVTCYLSVATVVCVFVCAFSLYPSQPDETFEKTGLTSNSFAIDLTHSPVSRSSSLHSPNFAPRGKKSDLHGLASPVRGQLRGNSPLANIQNSLYTGVIALGSPPVPVSVIFDTGSANLWTMESLARQSMSLKNSSQSFAIEYGSGRVAGTVAKDDVKVGGIHVTDTSFGLVLPESMTVDFQDNAHGILGLAFRSISVNELPTVLDDMVMQHPTFPKVFSFYLTRNPGEPGSKVMFGEMDHSKFIASPLERVPLTSRSYWNVKLTSFGLNGETMMRGAGTAIVDSGTSFIGVPETVHAEVVEKLWQGRSCAMSDIDEHSYLVCDCTFGGVDSFETLTIRLAGTNGSTVNLDLEPQHYIQVYPSLFRTYCVPLVLPIASDKFHPNGVYVLGMPVLRAFYTVFDFSQENASVSFAKSAATLANTSSSLFTWRRLLFVLTCIAQAYIIFNACKGPSITNKIIDSFVQISPFHCAYPDIDSAAEEKSASTSEVLTV